MHPGSGPWLTLVLARAEVGDLAGARAAADTVRRLTPNLLESRMRGEWLGSDAWLHARNTALLRKVLDAGSA